MNRWLRIGGWTAIALVLLWIAFEVITAVLGFLSWVISTAITLAVVAVVLYVGYLLVSRYVLSDDTETETTRAKEYEF